jgi:hypothetical protein
MGENGSNKMQTTVVIIALATDSNVDNSLASTADEIQKHTYQLIVICEIARICRLTIYEVDIVPLLLRISEC